MTPEQLRGLRLRIDSLLGSKPATVDSDEDEILSALIDSLRGLVTSPPPIPVLRKAPFWPQMKRGVEGIREFLSKHAPEVTRKRLERRRAYSIMTDVLVAWMQERKIPVTLRTMAQQLDKVPSLMDRAFPGYAAAGMLGWVFRTRS